jgi:hypothetical protein
MNAIFFGLLAIFSLFIFMNLGKVKASKKQMDRDDRIKWGKRLKTIFRNSRDGSKIIEGEAEEINTDSRE